MIKKIPVLACKYQRSFIGLEGFLMEQNLIPDKYNPLYVVTKALKSYEI